MVMCIIMNIHNHYEIVMFMHTVSWVPASINHNMHQWSIHCVNKYYTELEVSVVLKQFVDYLLG